MPRKAVLIVLSVCFIVFGLGLGLWAQNIPDKAGDEESSAVAFKENIAQLRGDLEKTRQAQEKSYQELAVKLDQVLSNQQRILKELDVIRVRVSRGR